MTPYAVFYSPRTAEQLHRIARYINRQSGTRPGQLGPGDDYTEKVMDYCEQELALVPHQGECRDDLAPGLRVTNYKGSLKVAFIVDDAAQQIAIHGFYGAKQRWESAGKWLSVRRAVKALGPLGI